MSKTDDTSNIATFEHYDTLADRELDAVTGAYREPVYIDKQQDLRTSDRGWCPDSEVRTPLRRSLMRTSESKGH